ncbi:RtcB family protein [Acidithiobacillus sp. M4-SHS-6]|uniref:RtcB family protein n=1 Tax=Acidithiobacillus sp. M4-SHS-6 TaxID=3383024 RepID=UPI0039BE0307
MEIIERGGVPVYLWADLGQVESQAMQQLGNISRLPVVSGHVAVMPDVHLGKGATVGSVIPTQDAIVPASVGVDLGCGMCAAQLTLHANDLPDDLKSIRTQIEQDIPVGQGMHDDRSFHEKLAARLEPGFDAIMQRAPDLLSRRRTRDAWAYQIGTLGGGNHFIELCLDERDQVWVMLHSGSRGIGNAIGEYYINKAKEHLARLGYKLPDKDLAWLPEGTPVFADYWAALSWAQDYAAMNREAMLQAVLDGIRRHLPPFQMQQKVINCHHNYVAREVHHGNRLYITRKGAIRAREGDLGIIPGSMGTASYIVRGKGNEEAYCSCSHGAGRVMSRGAAKRAFTDEDIAEQLAGVECRRDIGIVDELPGAYKNIDAVMEQQKDLVSVVARLKQVLCVKG